MKKEGNNFYLPTLLRMGDLDIRGVAAENVTLTANEYLRRLSEMLNLIPDSLNILTKTDSISDMDTNTVNFSVEERECLSALKASLDEVGAYTLSSALEDVLNEKTPPQDVTSALSFFSEKVTKVRNVPKSLIGGGGAYEPLYVDMLGNKLSNVLYQLDKNEERRKLQILVVDDASFMLKNISSMLDKYKVYSLAKPTMVEMFLDNIVPELFILDYKMPEMSGFDLVPIIRARDEHRDTPIIFLTASGTTETFSAAMQLGICDFIVKPFRVDVLQKKVAAHIVRKKTF
ncbi:MAG: response regulator [Oscillospiraceae bacterium]|nr:response regulator [Oscillospiraceae bacterium]